MNEQAREAKREYMRRYMKLYRSRPDKKEQLKKYEENFWLKRSGVEVRCLDTLVDELKQLKQQHE